MPAALSTHLVEGEQRVLLGEQTDGKRLLQDHGLGLFLRWQKMLIYAG